MNPLEWPDNHHLNAAEGWVELGNCTEAESELAHITPERQVHPDVLHVRIQICMVAKRWAEALDAARALVDVQPKRAHGWIDRSNALHFLGRYREAYDELFPALGLFPKNPTIPYNLACFESRMGNLEAARDWLGKALALDEGGKLRQASLEDPDLEPLRNQISQL